MALKNILNRNESRALLERLPEPKLVWKYFLYCTEHPRPSHKLDGFRAALSALAPDLQCEVHSDVAGNLLLRRPACPGYEDVPGVCIQAHLDMVTSANSDVKFNFDVDPINVRLEEKNGETWMKATGTTLGADNGIGVAAALAVLEEAALGKFKHGLLEALFTADEETTMGGAENLSADGFVRSDILLNVDSEEEYSICIGCAGGAENSYSKELRRDESASGLKFFHVSLSGLLGGHSGIEIHEGKGNALKIVNKLVRMTRAAVPSLRVVSFTGGGAPNVIPREASVLVGVCESEVEALNTSLENHFRSMQLLYLSVESTKNEHGTRVSTMKLDVIPEEGAATPLDKQSSEWLLSFVDTFHTGVIRMSYDVPGLVETSVNLSNVQLARDSTSFSAHSFARSSSGIALAQFQDYAEAFASLAGAQVSGPECAFPGWNPDITSMALAVMKQAHQETLQKEARVYAVHAGLECGLIQAVYPKISCVSIGPEIHHAHSPDECILVPSVERFYVLLCRFLELISQKKKE